MKLLITLAITFLIIPLFAAAQNSFPLDLLWEAATFTPADFPGKPLPIAGSRVTVVAVTPTQNSRDIEYSWFVKDISSSRPEVDLKGVGRDTFTFTAERIIPNFIHEIELVARNTRTNVTATGRVEIPVVRPEVRLYATGDTLMRNLVRRQLVVEPGVNIDVVAKPFYFIASALNNLRFIWSFNNQKLSSDDRPDVLSLKINPASGFGRESSLGVEIENRSSSRERAQASSILLVRPSP